MISDNPIVVLGIVDCSLYIRHIALKDENHKKRMDMLAYIPVEYNYLETLAKMFIFAARQNQVNQGNNFNKAPNGRIPLQWIQTHHSLDRLLKIHSGINKSSWDELEMIAKFRHYLFFSDSLGRKK